MLGELIFREYADLLQIQQDTNSSISSIVQTTLENLSSYGLATKILSKVNKFSVGVIQVNENIEKISNNLDYCFIFSKYLYLSYSRLILSSVFELDEFEFNSYTTTLSRLKNSYSLPIKTLDKITISASHFFTETVGVSLKDLPYSTPAALQSVDTFYAVQGTSVPFTLKITITSKSKFNLITFVKYNKDDIVKSTISDSYVIDNVLVCSPTNSITLTLLTNHFIAGFYHITAYTATYSPRGTLSFDLDVSEKTQVKLEQAEPIDTIISTDIYKVFSSDRFTKLQEGIEKTFILEPGEVSDTETIDSSPQVSGIYTYTTGIPNIGRDKFFRVNYDRTGSDIMLEQTVELDIIEIKSSNAVGASITYDPSIFEFASTDIEDILTAAGNNTFYIISEGSYYGYDTKTYLAYAEVANGTSAFYLGPDVAENEYSNLKSMFSEGNKLIIKFKYKARLEDIYTTYLTIKEGASIKISTTNPVNISLYDVSHERANMQLLVTKDLSEFTYSFPKGTYLLRIKDDYGTFVTDTDFTKDGTVEVNAFNRAAESVDAVGLLDYKPNFNYYYYNENTGYYYFIVEKAVALGDTGSNATFSLTDINNLNQYYVYSVESTPITYRVVLTLLSSNKNKTPIFREYELEVGNEIV